MQVSNTRGYCRACGDRGRSPLLQSHCVTRHRGIVELVHFYCTLAVVPMEMLHADSLIIFILDHLFKIRADKHVLGFELETCKADGIMSSCWCGCKTVLSTIKQTVRNLTVVYCSRVALCLLKTGEQTLYMCMWSASCPTPAASLQTSSQGRLLLSMANTTTLQLTGCD